MAKRKRNTISHVVKKESGKDLDENSDGLFKMVTLSDDIADGAKS